jgi:hypothetical protein
MSNQNSPNYTTLEAMSALGITARSAFHHLRRKYPQAFIVVSQGTGKKHPTTYDKTALDKVIQWRNVLKDYNEGIAIISNMKE